jgi:hypothetical protein
MAQPPVIVSTLSTVNAPHRRKLSAEELAACVLDEEIARKNPGHMSVFFGELPLEQQEAFCASAGVGPGALGRAAAAFGAWSGENYPAADLA